MFFAPKKVLKESPPLAVWFGCRGALCRMQWLSWCPFCRMQWLSWCPFCRMQWLSLCPLQNEVVVVASLAERSGYPDAPDKDVGYHAHNTECDGESSLSLSLLFRLKVCARLGGLPSSYQLSLLLRCKHHAFVCFLRGARGVG